MATRLAPARPVRSLRPDVAPAPAERRHLQVVPPGYVTERARRRRARRVVLLTGVAIAAGLFGVVAFHVVLTQNELAIQHLHSRADAASVKQQQLRLQVAELESPERVVDAAQKLGMAPPVTVHYLSPDGPTAAPVPAPPQRPTVTPTTVATHVVPKPATTATKPAAAKTPVTTAVPAKTAAQKTATPPTTAAPAQHR
jgi:cell division protein FtsL